MTVKIINLLEVINVKASQAETTAVTLDCSDGA